LKKRVRLQSMLPFYLFVFGACLIVTAYADRTITVMSETRPLQNRTCIVIDPGHGGEDGGAISCTGVLESKINLEISQRLNDLLHYLGYDTLMIRTEDVSVYTDGETIAARKVSDLKQRVKILNETSNALLISIHQNHYSENKYSGAQVFYSATKNSEDLAKKLQGLLVTTINPGSRRQAKKASGIYLMEHINCDGILIECGFLSNPQEEAKLQSAAYQKKLCCVFASAISNYLDRNNAD